VTPTPPPASRGDAGQSTAAGALAAAPSVDELTRVVALDGPAGSGKSTVSRLVAQALGWRFVDTGATYRAVTLAVLRSGVALDDADAVAKVAAASRVELGTDPGVPAVSLDGQDVSTEIRGPEVTASVSAVSAIPKVREHLIELQRSCMGTSGSVVEGRDIATVVAPKAAVKVYLDARPEVRALRRAGDVHTGVGGTGASAPTAVEDDIRRRDALDNQTNRLEASDGAVHLDTSELTLEQVVHEVVALVQQAGLVPPMPAAGESHDG
jgi:CMP/dCMP kinase